MISLQSDQIKPIIKKKFVEIFCTYLIRLSTGQEDKDGINFCIWSLGKFLEAANKPNIENALNGGLRRQLMGEKFDEGLVELVLLFFKDSNFEEVIQVYEFLEKFLEKKMGDQKLVTVLAFSQLIQSLALHYDKSELNDQEEWIYSIIEILLQTIKDKHELVRKHSIKGLGNICYLLKGDSESFKLQISSELCADILNSLFYALDDYSKLCVREVLLSLQKIIEWMDLSVVGPCMQGLLARLPESFERDDAIVRMSAFNLFGKLSRLLNLLPRGLDYLQDHIHFHLVSIFIHISDDNRAVQQAAVESLREISKVLDISELIKLVENYQEQQIEGNNNFDKTENFVILIIEILWIHFSDKFSQYLQSLQNFCTSPDDSVRAAAGLLLCIILKKQNDIQGVVNFDIIYEKLHTLMNDNATKVKNKVIRSLLLFSN